MGQHPAPAVHVAVEQVAGSVGGHLLAVSFTGIATGQDLDALLRQSSRGRPVSRIDPLGELTAIPDYVPLSRLVEAYREPLADLAPVAIIGHCTAAALTITIADDLVRHTGQLPVVVLLDPVRPTPAGTVSAFERRRQALGAGGAAIPGLELECAHAPERALRAMSDQLLADGMAFIAEGGLSDDEAVAVADELVGRYRAWLGFLLASAHTDLADPMTTSYYVLSTDRDLPAGLGRVGRATTRRAAVPADRLLMDSRVRELVLDLLEEGHG